ncbi:MAG: hypothetical protein K0S30_2099 [Clostridia bacterium]|nr:hypothetical protein [Clostridia bacterium]
MSLSKKSIHRINKAVETQDFEKDSSVPLPPPTLSDTEKTPKNPLQKSRMIQNLPDYLL